MEKDHAAQLEQSKSEFRSKLGADIEITRAMSAELESLQQENEVSRLRLLQSRENPRNSLGNLEMSQRIEVMNVRRNSITSLEHLTLTFSQHHQQVQLEASKNASLKDDLSEYREKLEKSENQNDALEATIMARDEKILESEKKLEMTENQIEALEATIMAEMRKFVKSRRTELKR